MFGQFCLIYNIIQYISSVSRIAKVEIERSMPFWEKRIELIADRLGIQSIFYRSTRTSSLSAGLENEH